MTKETEERIFKGEGPLSMPGFVVVDLGRAAPDVCLNGPRRKAKTERPRMRSEIFTRAQSETLKWLNEKRLNDFSWEEKREKTRVVRQRLSDAWKRMRDYGSKAQDEYQKWIAGGLHETQNRHARTEASLHPDQWTNLWSDANEEFSRKSRYIERLYESIDHFNKLAGRYCELRRYVIDVEKRRGYSSRSTTRNQGGRDAGLKARSTEDRSLREDYDPSPKVEKILNALLEMIDRWGGLDGYESRAEVWREVYQKIEDGDLEGSEAANNVSEALRSHMKDRGFGDKFPGTVEEIEQLVRILCRD